MGNALNERAKKVFENKAVDDEKRIITLEKDLKDARDKAEAADTAYEEVAKNLASCDSDLEKGRELMLESRRSGSWRRSSGWWPTTSSPWRWPRRGPTLLTSLCRSCSRRWTGWRTSWCPSRRST